MPASEETVRRHLSNYRRLLDNEEERLAALARLADEPRRGDIEAKLRELRGSRDELEETMRALLSTPSKHSAQPAQGIPS